MLTMNIENERMSIRSSFIIKCRFRERIWYLQRGPEPFCLPAGQACLERNFDF